MLVVTFVPLTVRGLLRGAPQFAHTSNIAVIVSVRAACMMSLRGCRLIVVSSVIVSTGSCSMPRLCLSRPPIVQRLIYLHHIIVHNPTHSIIIAHITEANCGISKTRL